MRLDRSDELGGLTRRGQTGEKEGAVANMAPPLFPG